MLSLLPVELLLRIIHELKTNDLLTFSRTNHFFYQWFKDLLANFTITKNDDDISPLISIYVKIGNYIEAANFINPNPGKFYLQTVIIPRILKGEWKMKDIELYKSHVSPELLMMFPFLDCDEFFVKFFNLARLQWEKLNEETGEGSVDRLHPHLKLDLVLSVTKYNFLMFYKSILIRNDPTIFLERDRDLKYVCHQMNIPFAIYLMEDSIFEENEQVRKIFKATLEKKDLVGKKLLMNKFPLQTLSFACSIGENDLVQDHINENLHICYDEFYPMPLLIACQKGHLKVVQLLVSNGVKINTLLRYWPKRWWGIQEKITPLIACCRENRVKIAEYLIKNGANVNLPDQNGKTPLFHAVWNGNNSLARLLLENGAKVNQKMRGKTVIQYICASHDKAVTPRMLSLLIKHGANLNSQLNCDGDTVLTRTLHRGSIDVIKTLLNGGYIIQEKDLVNAYYGGLDGNILDFILNNFSNKKKIKSLDLTFTCFWQRTELTEIFINHGFDVNNRDVYGNTLLIQAIQYHHEMTPHYGILPVIQFLLTKGALVNAKNYRGETALMKAVTHNQKGIIITLLRHGAKLKTRNNDGETALSIALKNNYLETAVLLQKLQKTNRLHWWIDEISDIKLYFLFSKELVTE